MLTVHMNIAATQRNALIISMYNVRPVLLLLRITKDPCEGKGRSGGKGCGGGKGFGGGKGCDLQKVGYSPMDIGATK